MNAKTAALRFLLVDDNSSFLELLEMMLREVGAKNIQKASTKEEAWAIYKAFQPDVCLIDIELTPGQKDGGDLAFQIREAKQFVPIIFITSYFKEDYYEYVKPIGPSSFLDKHLTRLKLLQSVELAVLQAEQHMLAYARSGINQQSTSAQGRSIHFSKNKQVFFRVGDSLKPFNIDEIDFFYANDGSTNARIKGRNFPTNVKLKSIAEEFSPKFLRCHKKYVVNVDRITSVQVNEGKVKIGDSVITIGYAYRKDFLMGLNLLK